MSKPKTKRAKQNAQNAGKPHHRWGDFKFFNGSRNVVVAECQKDGCKAQIKRDENGGPRGGLIITYNAGGRAKAFTTEKPECVALG